ncbi:MAG TPA: radical SAM protein [Methanospirillum sp.]|uniref:radical SAM protein n=1 Tax=Methanospirillum sp. TaxID=45200 RepID=UPI002C99EFB7|nr:radical SAM protein [Methanospirillum sp.]HWQ63124.1 radical SAM protein [Methanospirillum sp.]
MHDYLTIKKTDSLPRLPLSASIDLTYRCNNNCLHCWLRISPDSEKKEDELTTGEIFQIIDEGRRLGCRYWSISGGEPMLIPDFALIFDYITNRSSSYAINTNGTLITPDIALLMRRKGSKMIALYGASEEIHDMVTRNPGSFHATMNGFQLLRDVKAEFIVQIIPMQKNYHEFSAMIELAKTLSPHYRIGASWLYLSADGSPEHNARIEGQRLPPQEVIALDKPDLTYEEKCQQKSSHIEKVHDDHLFSRCINGKREFHIDPYGSMSFCSFIKDPALRYDLRTGSVQDCWDVFIPSLKDAVTGGVEYEENCKSCKRRSDCKWCAVYSYLETGRYSAKVPYLCGVAEQAKQFKTEWQEKHRRYFKFAGITVCVESNLDFNQVKIKEELNVFMVDGPGEDNVILRHYFELPPLNGDLGKEFYRKCPWVIYRKKNSWIYLGISSDPHNYQIYKVAVFSADHTNAKIFHLPSDEEITTAQGWNSLSLLPTDQIWIGPLLADRNAVLMHSAAVILNGQGLVFIGHSEAGKSTTVTLLKQAAQQSDLLSVEILCDDRNILQRTDTMWQVHGTWSHGTVSDVSAASAPIRGILFLQKDNENTITPLIDRKMIWKQLLATLIRPLGTVEWWEKELDILERIVAEIPCYSMKFDKTGLIVPKLVHLVKELE